jgi:hypothetical protein
MTTHKLTNEIIEAAISGFEGQKHQIDAQIAELRAMLNGTPASVAAPIPGKTRRKFSAAALKHMREAQQRRWAKAKGTAETALEGKSEPVAAKKKRRKLSAAGRAAIVAALRKRWADKKAAAKS